LGCHVRWSANGDRIAYSHGDVTGVTVMNLDGSGKRTLTKADVGGRSITDVASISADGRRVCIATVPAGQPVGDVARNLYCNTIADVETRRQVPLPVRGELPAALFAPDGGTLLRVKNGSQTELVLLDSDDRVIARTIESAAMAGFALLAYIP
jgi:Tol biopolymer transport system component